MQFGQINIDDRIIQALQADELVIFVGAGVSMNSPCFCPDFKELARQIGENSGIALNNNFMSIDQYLGKLSDSNIEIINKSKEVMFACHEDKANADNLQELSQSPLHNYIVQILHGANNKKIRLVTTNFEHFFTKACHELVNPETCPIYYAPALPNGSNFSGLVYLHGAYEDTSDGKELVLTDKDFGRAYLSNGYANKFIKELFSSHYTVLFIGYSYDDLMMHYLTRALNTISSEKCFAFVADNHITNDNNDSDITKISDTPHTMSYSEDPSKTLQQKWQALNIIPIIYNIYNHDHAPLLVSLKELSDFISLDSLKLQDRIIKLCSQDHDLTQADIDFIIYMARDKQYFDIVYKHTANVKFIDIFKDNDLLDEAFDADSSKSAKPYIIDLHAWMATMFFNYPHELFRIKHLIRKPITARLWVALVDEIYQYIKSPGTINYEILTEKLDLFIPVILEYNPIKLSENSDYYKFSITRLVQLLFKVANTTCFQYAQKLFFYITTPHTTAVYSSITNTVTKEVRFYCDHSYLKTTTNILINDKINILPPDFFEKMVTNYQAIIIKLSAITPHSFKNHIREDLSASLYISIFKKYLHIKSQHHDTLFDEIHSIVEQYDINKTKANVECAWIEHQELPDFLNLTFLKNHTTSQIIDWINDPSKLISYCHSEYKYKIDIHSIYDNIILKIIADSFESDYTYCVNLLSHLDPLPPDCYSAIPDSIDVTENDTSLIDNIGPLLQLTGNEDYYRAVFCLLNKTIADHKIWFSNCFQKIETKLLSAENILNHVPGTQSVFDSSDPNNTKQFDIALNSFGGEYAKLLLTCLTYKYNTSNNRDKWTGIPEQYTICINHILHAQNFNYQMARIILYSNIYYYNSIDTNHAIPHIFNGLYWEGDSTETKQLFIQAWQGFLYGGQLSPINIVNLYNQGILFCIQNFDLFPEICQEMLCSFVILLGFNAPAITKLQIVKSLLDITQNYAELSNIPAFTLRTILSYIRTKTTSEITPEWNSWIKDFISERVRNIPTGVSFTMKEINLLNEFFYYSTDSSLHEDILNFITASIPNISSNTLNSRCFTLPILNRHFTGDTLNKLSRISLARSLELISPKLSPYLFNTAAHDLQIIVSENGILDNETLQIIEHAIQINDDLTVSKKSDILSSLRSSYTPA